MSHMNAPWGKRRCYPYTSDSYLSFFKDSITYCAEDGGEDVPVSSCLNDRTFLGLFRHCGKSR